MRFLVACLSVLLVAGCSSYQLQTPDSSRVVHVPFIQNDSDGMFTNSLARALSHHGFRLERQAPYRIEVSLDSKKTRPLGYTYSYDTAGNPTKALQANEARLEWSCRVAIKSSSLEGFIAGPETLSAGLDFDYEIEEMPFNHVQQSAGQLNIRQEAVYTAQSALRDKLAGEIAHWVMVQWPLVFKSPVPAQ